jgi:hypothetical protein
MNWLWAGDVAREANQILDTGSRNKVLIFDTDAAREVVAVYAGFDSEYVAGHKRVIPLWIQMGKFVSLQSHAVTKMMG